MSNGNPAAKKGLSPLAWIGIGCGALALLAVVGVVGVVGFGAWKAKEFVEEHKDEFEVNPAKAMAEIFVRANPDLDLVSTDDDNGTMTIRNKKTGEETTVDFDELAKGKFSFSNKDGDYTIDTSGADEGGGVVLSGPQGETRFGAGAGAEDAPDWLPIYPEATEVESGYSAVSDDGVQGLISIKTNDSVQEVLDHYKSTLEDQGFEVQVTSTSGPQGAGGVVIANRDRRTVHAGINQQDGVTQIALQYSDTP